VAWLADLYDLAQLAGTWSAPHVSLSEAGEVTFEWWHGERKLTLYFGADHVEAIKVWGTHIDDEMQHLEDMSVDTFPALWAWLHGG
jgi:hypothetical protein